MPKAIKASIIEQGPKIISIPLDQIDFEGSQAQNIRSEINLESILELAESIERYGLQNPIMLYTNGNNEGYNIISGHRRYSAYSQLHKQGKESYATIPAIISNKIKELDQLTAMQLIENIQREDLPPHDIERAVYIFRHERELSSKEASKELGRSSSWISSHCTAYRARKIIIQEFPERKEDLLKFPTSTMAVIGSSKKNDLEIIDHYLATIKLGGSKEAAEKYRKNQLDKELEEEPEEPEEEPQGPKKLIRPKKLKKAQKQQQEGPKKLINPESNPETIKQLKVTIDPPTSYPNDAGIELLALPHPISPYNIAEKIPKLAKWYVNHKKEVQIVPGKILPQAIAIQTILNKWINLSEGYAAAASTKNFITIGLHQSKIAHCHHAHDLLAPPQIEQIEQLEELEELEIKISQIIIEPAPQPQPTPQPEELETLEELEIKISQIIIEPAPQPQPTPQPEPEPEDENPAIARLKNQILQIPDIPPPKIK